MTKPVYFISDLHLGASYLKNPLEYERKVVRWLRTIASDASEIYLLGDILDYWYEYRYVVPRGFTRFFGALAELADAGVKITWFIGNHDIWIFDYLPKELGIRVVDGNEIVEIAGKRFFLAHGDGLGNLPKGFRFIRRLFRNRICQRMFSAIHPRWTIPFAHRWSSHSRDFDGKSPAFSGNDNENFITFAREYLSSDPTIDYFIFGHYHIMLDYKLSETSRLIILGDWIHHFSYAKFNENKVELISFCENSATTPTDLT